MTDGRTGPGDDLVRRKEDRKFDGQTGDKQKCLSSPTSNQKHDSYDRGNSGYFERVSDVGHVARNSVPASAAMPVEPLDDVVVPDADRAVLEDVGKQEAQCDEY